MFDQQTPSNLPVDPVRNNISNGVEDMFEKTEPKPAAPPAPMAPPRLPSVAPAKEGPMMPPPPQPMAPRPPAPAPIAPPLPSVALPARRSLDEGGAKEGEPVQMQTPGQGWKKILLIVGGLVILAVAGLAIKFFVFDKAKQASPVIAPASPAPVQTVPEVTPPPADSAGATSAPEAVLPAAVDSDNDGLTDEEEIQLGIDPRNPDTDGDGLFDGEEINVYKTNPLDRDTDKDSYLDGEEVQKGYNPLGPGKLFTVPTTTP